MKIMIDAHKGAYIPKRAHPTDAGLDLFAPCCFTVPAHGEIHIDTGVHFAIPEGWVGYVCNKSGLNLRDGISSSLGVIDADYRGPVVVALHNRTDADRTFFRGDKISQIVITPCLLEDLELVKELPKTERGSGGFGSTGR